MAFCGLVGGLLTVVYQDFSERAISWWTIPLLLFVGIVLAMQDNLFEWWHLGMNLMIILLQLAVVTFYFSLKHNQLINITRVYLGVGDILLLIAIAPLFSPLMFCSFFVGSTILTLLGFILWRSVHSSLKTIPLAGAMSFFLILTITVFEWYGWSCYDDFMILQLIYG